MATRKPRPQPYRVSWPLNAGQIENIDYMFQLLFDDIRNGAIASSGGSSDAGDLTGVVAVENGGTGLSVYAIGDILYASGTTTLSKLAIGAAGKILRSNGTTPTWSAWTTPSTFAQGDLIYASGTDVLAVLAKSTSATRYLSNTGTSNDPAWAQVSLANGVTGNLDWANLPSGSGTWTANPTISGTLSVPGAGSQSEHYGATSTAAGANSTVLGYGATGAASDSVAIGNSANADTSGFNSGDKGIAIGIAAKTVNGGSVAVGRGAGEQSGTTGGTFVGGNVAIGRNALVQAGLDTSIAIGYFAEVLEDTANDGCIAIGASASAKNNAFAFGGSSKSWFTSAIALGYRSETTAANQLVVGNYGDGVKGPITNIFFGSGVASANPLSFTIHGTAGNAGGIDGADVILAGGYAGSIADDGGYIRFKTTPSLSGFEAERLRIEPGGDLVIGTGNDVIVGSNTLITSDLLNVANATNRLAYANLTAATAASKLLGRQSASSGDWEEITLGTGLSMSGTTLNATATSSLTMSQVAARAIHGI